MISQRNSGADLTGLAAEPTPKTKTENPLSWDYSDSNEAVVRFTSPELSGYILGESEVDIYEVVPPHEPGEPCTSVLLTADPLNFCKAQAVINREVRVRHELAQRCLGKLIVAA
jgi:hypothetical protein